MPVGREGEGGRKRERGVIESNVGQGACLSIDEDMLRDTHRYEDMRKRHVSLQAGEDTHGCESDGGAAPCS